MMPGYRGEKPDLASLDRDVLWGAILRLARRSRATDSGCVVTDRGFYGGGYSQVSINGYPVLGHLASWTYFAGPIEGDLEVDHGCEVKPCWNPAHLEPVTHEENMARHRESKFGTREKLPPIWVRQPGYSSERVRAWRAEQRLLGRKPS